MRNAILMIALALSAVGASLSYSIKDEKNISELVEANIEALSLETQDDFPCIVRPGSSCMEWIVLSCGVANAVHYKGYINYMEVDE